MGMGCQVLVQSAATGPAELLGTDVAGLGTGFYPNS